VLAERLKEAKPVLPMGKFGLAVPVARDGRIIEDAEGVVQPVVDVLGGALTEKYNDGFETTTGAEVEVAFEHARGGFGGVTAIE